ncbi:glycosyltransferase family 25 protein [Methylobacterium durans]|uniref:Glycosyl transferase family 25 domain-containing protein n=1 Tax=Methylobacterium durans TaxID=2202825 RepID=A0A2U8W261_9HYPH|nr:glycosyltransferase family 25 protein [Methylobacterium durans]AWN40184.1 hypothetical protein DK389_06110 [Methylobacterium durans]
MRQQDVDVAKDKMDSTVLCWCEGRFQEVPRPDWWRSDNNCGTLNFPVKAEYAVGETARVSLYYVASNDGWIIRFQNSNNLTFDILSRNRADLLDFFTTWIPVFLQLRPAAVQERQPNSEQLESAVPFPVVFVINMDQRLDRWSAIQAECLTVGITPNRVSAIEYTPGWIGCGYSHLKCIQMAKERRLPWVLILEDDATVTEEGMTRFKAMLPYLWFNRDKWERFNGGPTLPADAIIRLMDLERKLLYARGYTSHFNLIHSGAYDLILRWNHDYGQQIDVYFIELEKKFRTNFSSIATVPHISIQRPGSSDISTDGYGVGDDYSNFFRFSEAVMRDFLRKLSAQC